MVIDYLKHILFRNSSPKEVSSIEQKLLTLISNPLVTISNSEIQSRVKQLKKSKKVISVKDLGAGSRSIIGTERQVSKIAKYASIQPKFGELYSNIIKEFNIDLSIELGTSFGIGTSYLALSSKNVVTIEGCPNTAQIAKDTFENLRIKNIEIKVGEFSSVLNTITIPSTDPIFVYIDGNHQYSPTVEYFEFFKKILPTNSILIFDDIYWSKEMKKAWAYIKSQPYFSVDLFKIGIVILSEKDESVSVKKYF